QVPASLVGRVAMQVRALMSAADPRMEGGAPLGPHEQDIVGERLGRLTIDYPALEAVLRDFVPHLTSPQDLYALFLHLVHVTRMMQLLAHVALMRDSVAEAAVQVSATSKKATKKATKKTSRRSRR
ncbi:MAG: hypothetical protein AAB426_00690, partial [Myxococcota bacterium]